MKNKKLKFQLKYFLYAFIAIILVVSLLSLLSKSTLPTDTEFEAVQRINQNAGPLQIEEEFLGPNDPNNPITPPIND
jgi:hypothetical protein